MKLLHKLKAWHLRRALVRQRAENIASLKSGRAIAKRIKIEMAREIRLSVNQASPAFSRFAAPLPRKSSGRGNGGERQTNCQISAILRKIQFERRAV